MKNSGTKTVKTAVIAIAAAAVIGAGAFGISRMNRPSPELTSEEVPQVQEQEEPAIALQPGEEPAGALQLEEPADTSQPEEEPEPQKKDPVEAFREAEEAAGRIVLKGEIATYNYEATVELQGFPDYNAAWTDRSQKYRIIVLSEPQEVTLQSVDGPYKSTLKMLSVDDAGISEELDGHRIVFSIDPETTWWKSDTSIPLGAPDVKDVHVIDAEPEITRKPKGN